MNLKQGLQYCRAKCRAVYLVGEHATAVMYAVCEFRDAHVMLILASIVLLAGIVLIIADKVMTLCGFVCE